MKDEAAGMVIKEYIGSVVKSTLKKPITNHKKCGGISKHTVKKDITIDDYRDTLFSSLEKKNALYEIN